MATAATGRPTRTRTARTATKAAPAKAVAPKADVPAEVEVSEGETFVVDLVHEGDTKSYAKFVPPVGSGCVGQFYAPLGTKAAKVKISG